MLYPSFKELLSYETIARSISPYFSKKYSLSNAGDILSSFKGQGMEFDEVREYVYGDDVRNIEWRVSARTQQTHVKVYREEKKRNIIIAVDNNDYMHFGTRGTFKNVQAARAAALIGFAAHANTDRVGMYIFGRQRNRFTFLKPHNSEKPLYKGLKILSGEMKTDTDNSENYSLEGAIFNLKRMNENPNILFIISDFRGITEQFERNLYLLGRNPEIVFINLIDDSDSYIPDIGNIMLQYDKQRYCLNTSNKRAMEKYKKIFEEKQRFFERTAKHLNARIINLNTKDDVTKQITLGLRKN